MLLLLMLLCVPIVLAPLGETFEEEEEEEEVKELKLRAAKLKLLLAVVVVPARMRLRASSLTATKALRVVIVKSLSSVSRRRARIEETGAFLRPFVVSSVFLKKFNRKRLVVQQQKK